MGLFRKKNKVSKEQTDIKFEIESLKASDKLQDKRIDSIERFVRTLDTKLYIFEEEWKRKGKENNNGKHKK